MMHTFTDDDSATYGALMDAWRTSSTQFKVKQREVDLATRAQDEGTGDGPSPALLTECARLNALYDVDHAALKAFLNAI